MDDPIMGSAEVIRSCHLRVPASTSNLGPGFDVLGIALDCFLSVDVHLLRGASKVANLLDISITCNEPDISTDSSKNLISKVMLQVLGDPATMSIAANATLHLNVHNHIPLGRGLGSSGAAVVAAVMIADWLGNSNWTRQELISRAVAIEGHPDNVAASCLGGMVASYTSQASPAFSLRLPFDSDNIHIYTAIPDYTIPTTLARQALPSQYPLHAVVHSLQRVTLLTHLLSGNHFSASTMSSSVIGQPSSTLLTKAIMWDLLDDVIHQPPREKLLPGFLNTKSALKDASNVLGVCVSGAGPTVIILCTPQVDLAMLQQEVNKHYSCIVQVRRMQVSEGAILMET